MKKFKFGRGRRVLSDSIPNSFSFTSQNNVDQSTEITSNSITLTGIDTAAAISVTGGTYSLNGGSFTASSGTYYPGDTLRARLTSSSSYSTLLTVAITVGGITGNFQVTTEADPAGTDIPVIQPSVSYNGTQLSGGTPPADPERIYGYGKPSMAWIYGYRGMAVGSDDELMGVEAECAGGVAYIDLWFEGTTQRLYRSKQSVYSPRTGQMEDRVGYWFWLRVPSEQRGTGNIARIFAKAVPNDSEMQERVFGWYHGNYGTSIITDDTSVTGYRAPVDVGDRDSQKPMWVFPRTTKFDAVKTVNSAGSGTDNYATLRDALDALAAANSAIYPAWLSWDIVVYNTDNEGGVPSTYAGRWGGVGGAPCTRIRAATGVSARIYHNASFDPYNTVTTISADYGGTVDIPAWTWEPICNNLEFYGGASGTNTQGISHGSVAIDTANFNVILNRSTWSTFVMNGSKLTNSTMVAAGDMFHLYWNGSPAVFEGPKNPNYPGDNSVNLIDCDLEFANIGYGTHIEYRCNRVNSFSNPHDNAHGIIEGYIAGFEGTYLIANKPALRISYSGSGTTAKFRISRTNANSEALFELKVDDITTASVTLRFPYAFVDPIIGIESTGKSVHTMAQLATWISAQTDWSAVEPSGSLATNFAAWNLHEGNVAQSNINEWTSSDIKAATIADGYFTAVCWNDSHNEALHWLNFYYGGTPKSGLENCLMLRCVEIQSHWSTGHLNIEVTDSGDHENTARDIVVANCLAYSTNDSWGVLNGGIVNQGNGNGIVLSGDHVCLINNTFIGNVAGYRSELPYNKTGVYNTVVDLNEIGDYGQQWKTPSVMKMVNSAHKSATLSPASPTWQSGSWIWATTDLAMFRSDTDMRPLISGELNDHKVTYDSSLQMYDVTGTPYASTDFIGCFAGAAPNITPPLVTFSDETYPPNIDYPFDSGSGNEFATPTGPKFFLFGNWLQDGASMSTWAARGINVALAGKDDDFGFGGTTWRSAVTSAGMKMIVRPDHNSGPDTLIEDSNDPSVLCHMTYDEPEINSITDTALATEAASWKTAGSTKAIGVGFRGNGPGLEQNGYENYLSTPNIDWEWSDTYSFGGEQETYYFGDLQASYGYTGNFTTMVGKGAKTLRLGPYQGVDILYPNRTVFQFLASGRIGDKYGIDPPEPKDRLTAPQHSAMFWSSVVNGVSGIFYFSHYNAGSPDQVSDDTDSVMEGAIADAVTKIGILENQSGTNVLMDVENGGRKSYTFRPCCKTSGGTAGATYPAYPVTSIDSLFVSPTGIEMQAWFEGCEITVGGVEYRLVVNIDAERGHSLTDTRWGLTSESFSPGQVKCFKSTAPTTDIFA